MTAANIANNDDCNITVVIPTDVALEMTKLYLDHHSSSHWIGEDTIYDTYKHFKKRLDRLEIEIEDEKEERNED